MVNFVMVVDFVKTQSGDNEQTPEPNNLDMKFFYFPDEDSE